MFLILHILQPVSYTHLIPSPIGASAAIVPTEVPIDTDIKHPIINNPVTKRFDGSIDKLKFTVESTPPVSYTHLY